MKFILIKTKKKQKMKNVVFTERFLFKLEESIKKREICIVDQRLIDRYCLYEINKKLDKLLNKILIHLSSEDADPGETTILFDTLARMRGQILNTQEELMTKDAIEEYMEKIRFAAFELKKRMMSYQYTPTEQKVR